MKVRQADHNSIIQHKAGEIQGNWSSDQENDWTPVQYTMPQMAIVSGAFGVYNEFREIEELLCLSLARSWGEEAMIRRRM